MGCDWTGLQLPDLVVSGGGCRWARGEGGCLVRIHECSFFPPFPDVYYEPGGVFSIASGFCPGGGGCRYTSFFVVGVFYTAKEACTNSTIVYIYPCGLLGAREADV